MSGAYYNEFKPEAAHMLRQLIKDGLIAAGDVDERSIEDVRADDLRGYTQCHFFAGIGGWSVALRLAMWPDDRPVWTGSCPCQPFSTAGAQKGQSDERHLWPHWFSLIRECKPSVVFGEQVASAITYGWWDGVASDLETQDYACAAAVLPACSVGKPHKRDRLWFVANSESERSGGTSRTSSETVGRQAGSNSMQLGGAGQHSDVADSDSHNARGLPNQTGGAGQEGRLWRGVDTTDASLDVANADQQRSQRWEFLSERTSEWATGADGLEWLACPDGKQRPIKHGVRLLANGVQHRAPLLHGYGNAIVPQVAAEFIKATGLI